ncbi:MAG: hypothetical protein IJ008_01995 [Clostridia bacterium]|nr:hypothetical protein [Clostridia bacterium]
MKILDDLKIRNQELINKYTSEKDTQNVNLQNLIKNILSNEVGFKKLAFNEMYKVLRDLQYSKQEAISIFFELSKI